MRLKLFKKMFFTATAISLSGIVVLMLCLSFFVHNYLVGDKKESMWANCTNIADYVSEIERAGDFGTRMNIIMNIIGESSDTLFFVVDEDGAVISCSCSDWNVRDGCKHSRTPVAQKVMNDIGSDKYYLFGNLSGKTDDISYITAVPVNGGRARAVFGISPSHTMRDLMSEMYRAFAFSVIIPVVVMFVAIYIMSLRLTRPMRMMSQAAHNVSRGDFTMRIPVYGDDEISELSRSFNNMTDALSRLENMRRSFIGNVSHELRTPMTTIGGFIDGILDGTIPANQQEHYLHIISDEVKRLTRVVQSMLSLAELESGEMQISREQFDITQVVFEIALSQEKRITERNIEVQGLEDIPSAKVSADRDLIYQAVYNLIDNAVKFTPQDGYIRFTLENTGDGNCVLKIRNSGQGIEADDLPYVFDRFYKTDRSRSSNKESTGIGLYIVRTVVSIHGGTVTVRSTPGQYTEFEIVLPTASADTL